MMDPLSEDPTVTAFQARLKRANGVGWPISAVGFVAFVIGIFSQGSPAFSLPGLVLLFGGPLLMIVGLRITSACMRCPACEASLRERNGFPMNPTQCRRCGARLK